jgi:hypothetical protein
VNAPTLLGLPQDGQHHHTKDQYGTGKPFLYPRLSLLMDGITVEVWVWGLGVYAKLLADTEFQEVGNWVDTFRL